MTSLLRMAGNEQITEVLAGEFLPGFGAARDAALASEAMRQGTALPHPSAADSKLTMDTENKGTRILAGFS